MIAKIVIEKKMDKKQKHSEELSKYDLSYWDAKACKRTSDGAGSLMAVTGYRYMNQINEETQAMSLALMIYSLQQKNIRHRCKRGSHVLCFLQIVIGVLNEKNLYPFLYTFFLEL